ncbi:CHAT domain-containing protein [Halocola ammonii]
MLLLSIVALSQSFDPKLYNDRSEAIDSLMANGNYTEAAPLLDAQVEMLVSSKTYDSLYHFSYNAARARWKTVDARAGQRRVDELLEMVEEKDGNPHHILQVLNDKSWIYYETGDYKEAVAADSAYLKLCFKIPDPTPNELYMGHYNVAFGLVDAGKPREAAHHFEKSIIPLLADTASFRNDLINGYNGLGAALFRAGDYNKAEEAYKKSLELIQQQRDPFQKLANTANIYGNLSLIKQDKQDFIGCKEYLSKAIQYRTKSFEIAESEHLRDQERDHLMKHYRGLASVYLSLGDFSKSLKLLDHVHKERSQHLEPNDPKLHNYYEGYGSVQLAMGDYTAALENLKTYADLCLREYGVESFTTGIAFKRLGQIYLELNQFENAIDEFDQAIKSFEATEDPDKGNHLASALQYRAEVFSKLGQTENATRDINRAVRILQTSRSGFDITMARAYLIRARIFLRDKQFDEAEVSVDQAFELFGKERKLLSETIAPEAFLINSKIQFGRDQRNQENIEKALNLALQASAKLSESRSSFDKDESQVWYYETNSEIFDFAKTLSFKMYEVSGESKYLESLFQLAEGSKMLVLRNQLNTFSSLEFANIPDSILQREKELLDSLNFLESNPREYDQLLVAEANYRDFKKMIEQDFPEYFALKFNDKTPSLKEIRAELLKEGETLIQFSADDSLLFGTVITRENIKSLTLPKNLIYHLIDSLNNALVSNDLTSTGNISHELYKELFQPFEKWIASEKLLIVPDGKLFALNFEALRKEKGSEVTDYLLFDYSISYLLSASTSIAFKQLETSAKGILAVAPGFHEDQKARYRQLIEDSLNFDEKYLTLLQQPFAVQTAERIARLFPGEAMVKGEATEEKFRANAGRYGILHFGTHAEINHQSPLLSRLMLNAQSSSPSDDGMLHAYEIYNMQLRSEMVVLGACQTGAGKSHSSEGVMSLAHSFAYAGCPSVVMSLWQIDEKTSSEIIEAFYENLSEGESKVEALRKAKIEYLQNNQNELTAPYYWAGLVLMGDTTPISTLPGNSFHWVWWTVIVGVLVLFLIFLGKRRRTVRK